MPRVCISDIRTFKASLYATFYAASEEHPTTGQSKLIVPISTWSDTLANDASVPPAFSVSLLRFLVEESPPTFF